MQSIAIGDEGVVGLITYMRTDSTSLSDDAIAELRDVIRRDYGAKALPEAPNVYKTKSKNAAEAHEAVRPTAAMRRPASVASALSDEQRKLYDLIWKRTVACQMQHATLNTVSVDLGLRQGFSVPCQRHHRGRRRAFSPSTKKATGSEEPPRTTTKAASCRR